MRRISQKLIGVLFIVTGTSKLLEIHDFSDTIAEIVLSLSGMEISSFFAGVVAIVVSSIELVGGIGVFQDRWASRAVNALLVALTGFIALLLMTIIQDVKISCGCFGLIGIRLTPHQQIVLDIGLFFGLFWTIRDYSLLSKKKKLIEVGISLLTLLTLSSFLLVTWPTATNIRKIPKSSFSTPSGSNPNSFVLFLVDYDDFSCKLCLNGFLEFVDSLNGVVDSSNVKIVFRNQGLIKQDHTYYSSWLNSLGIKYSTAPDTLRFFDRYNVEKSSVVVVPYKGAFGYTRSFPMSGSDKAYLFKLLHE